MPRGIKFKTSITDYLIVVWYADSAPLVEVDREVYDNTYNNVATVLNPSNLGSAAYTFKFYHSSDGTTLETFLFSWAIDGNLNDGINLETYYYVVGGPEDVDPAADQNTLTDERLAGKNIIVFTKGVGVRKEADYTRSADEESISLNDGETFQLDDEITIVAWSIAGGGSTPVTSSTSVKVIDEDGTLDSTYYNKENIAAGEDTILTTTFPNFSTITPNTEIVFSTFTGDQRYWKLQFDTGDTVKLAGEDRNHIYLGKDARLRLFFYTDGSNIVGVVLGYEEANGGYYKAGQTSLGDKAGINQVVAAGGEAFTVDYPRVIEELEAEMTCTYTQYDSTNVVTENGVSVTYYPYRHKFAIGSGADAGKFKWPDNRDRTEKSLKYTDGTTDSSRMSQGVGGFQKNTTNINNIGIQLLNGQGGQNTNPLNYNGGPNDCGFAGMDSDSGYIDNDAEGQKRIKLSGGSETITNNIGKLPLVNL